MLDYKSHFYKKQRERAFFMKNRIDWRLAGSQFANDRFILEYYTDPKGRIVSRRLTLLGDKQQRTLARLVKRARLAGVVPFIRADSRRRYLMKGFKKKLKDAKIKKQKARNKKLRTFLRRCKPGFTIKIINGVPTEVEISEKIGSSEGAEKALFLEKYKTRTLAKKYGGRKWGVSYDKRDLRFNAPKTKRKIEEKLRNFLWEEKIKDIKVREQDLKSAIVKHVGFGFTQRYIKVYRRRRFVGKANGPKLWPCRRKQELLKATLGKKRESKFSKG